MHQGCVRSRQRRREGSGGWWPTSPSCRWGGRSTTPRSWPPTTSSICLATASPQAGGTAPAPPRSACRAKHRWPGSRPCSRAETPRLGNSSAGPTAATLCPPSTWSCVRPRACRSCTAWLTQKPAGRCFEHTMLGSPRRSATWTSTWAPAADTVVSNMCPDRGCWQLGLTIGRPERAIRCCTPTSWLPTASRDRTTAGQPWTAAICIGIGWPRTPSIGPPTNANLSGHWEWSGRQQTATATASSKGCPRCWSGPFPSAPARSTPSSTGWGRTVGSGHHG
jgi:hypothetical protein